MRSLLDRARDIMRLRSGAYRDCFRSAGGQKVLVDLAAFCRANQSCVVVGDRDDSLILEGRREVWLRIQNFSQLTVEELLALHPVKNLPPQEKDDA